MKSILSREFKAYFTSPIGYVFLTFYLFIFGFYFAGINLSQQLGDYSIIFSYLVNLLLFTIPLVTMRLLSEERKNKTDQLLLTSPVSVWGIILGKYLAAVLLLVLTLGLTLIQPLILEVLGDVPWPAVISTYIGYFLLGATLISISLFISAHTENQIIAAIGSIGIFLFLLLVDAIATLIPAQRLSSFIFILVIIAIVTLYIYLSIKDIYISLIVGFICAIITTLMYKFNGTLFDGLCTKILQWFSLFSRYNNFSSGLLDIGSIVYYLSFIFVFLFLTNQTIEKRRWS
ncbi:MAG: ABC transporter permease [Cellulosilyticum sp.]|nr:ABC transporter permease [Cellulosilyticum sp.]